jgi:hypothetical protein
VAAAAGVRAHRISAVGVVWKVDQENTTSSSSSSPGIIRRTMAKQLILNES